MFTEKIWKITQRSDLGNLPVEAGIMPLTAQVLVNRGINNVSDINRFLKPEIRYLSEPDVLQGVKDAAQLIKKVIKENRKICVFGDFDVDGVTSTALLYEALKSLKADVSYYIPCRFQEGYGLNINAVNKLSSQGCNLLITVDCGITAHNEIEEARKKGMEVIITDHHQPEGILPSANFVINPVLDGVEYIPAGVAVAYQLARVLTEEDSSEFLELVSLGSIADMVILKGDNRILVAEGLKKLSKSKRIGLISLANVSGIEIKRLDSFSVAFGLAPRINAGGRIANALESLELLLTKDETKALSIASKLDKLNRERRAIEDETLKEAKDLIERTFDPEKDKVIILCKDGWHDGVKGIVASRIQKEYCRPAFVCSERDGLIRGSARTFGDFNIKKALDSCSDLLENYGGHPAAAGVTFCAKNLESFKGKFNNLATDFYADRELKPKVDIDAEIDAKEFSKELVTEIQKLKPFGNGNPEPVFSLKNAYIKNHDLRGKKAIKVLKFDIQSAGLSIPGMAFTDGKAQIPNEPVDLSFSLDENTWQGKTEVRTKITNIRLHKFSLDRPKEFVEHLYQLPVETGRYENIAYAESFYTKVAGVSFDGRQDKVSKVQDGETILFIRERENPYDPNAIRVDTKSGINLGYLNRELAAKLSPHMDLGEKWTGEIGQVTGGNGRNYGVNIFVKKRGARKEVKDIVSQKITDPVEIKKMLVGNITLHQKQSEAIQSLKDGKNTLLIMGTGRGKSAVFHLHSALLAINENKITIVLYPLRSLIRDQFMYLEEAMAKIGLKVAKLTGESGVEERKVIFEELKSSQCHIILTTPEFLFHNSHSFENMKEKIGFFVVDEAHHLQTASIHHRPIYRKIHKVLKPLGNPVTLAATATADEIATNEIIKQLDIKNKIIDTTVRKNLLLDDKRGIVDKERALADIINEGNKTVIYTNSRESTSKLAENLTKLHPVYKHKIVYYHAGLNGEMREIVQDGFKNGTFTTVVATSAFGEGVNIPDIRNLALYHMPFSLVQYNQQCGRAGRDNEKANIHLLFGPRDAGLNYFILENVCPSKASLRKLFMVMKKMAKRSTFLANNADILAEYEANGYSGLTEKGIGSSLKVFKELGLIEIRVEEDGRVIEMISNVKVELEDSTFYEEAQNEKTVYEEFKEVALGSEVNELLKLFNQPIYPKSHVDEGVLEPV